jgi:photosystem II stability/assembly factor-like uncharacterized protein
MKCIIALITLFTLFTCNTASAQSLPSIQVLQDSIKSSFRGLSVPSDDVIWVSGSNGTVGRSTDAGKTWTWMIVPGFEKRDFRDIEAFDSLTAIIMAVDNPGNILKTTDGGKTWKVVFHKEQEGMFLDAMDFNGGKGICIGDPIVEDSTKPTKFFLLTTKDYGETWERPHWNVPLSSNRKMIFAGSGTNIISSPTKKSYYVFITGGTTSYFNDMAVEPKPNIMVHRKLPFMRGKETAGGFSICSNNAGEYYITGGDYVEYWKDSGNVVYTTNAGKTWKRSSVHGYRSCIIQADKKTFITCGTNGVDISFDGCKTWKLIHGDGAKGKDGFNVCAKSKTGKAVYFAGNGRIGKLILPLK